MKLVVPCFLFIVSALSLIITTSLLIILTNPIFSNVNMEFITLITGLICSISIFYISLFSGLLTLLQKKLRIVATAL